MSYNRLMPVIPDVADLPNPMTPPAPPHPSPEPEQRLDECIDEQIAILGDAVLGSCSLINDDVFRFSEEGLSEPQMSQAQVRLTQETLIAAKRELQSAAERIADTVALIEAALEETHDPVP